MCLRLMYASCVSVKERMDLFDVVSICFLVFAAGDLVTLLTEQEAPVDRALRLMLAAGLAVAALALHEHDFPVLVTVVAMLMIAGSQAALMWRSISLLKKKEREHE